MQVPRRGRQLQQLVGQQLWTFWADDLAGKGIHERFLGKRPIGKHVVPQLVAVGPRVEPRLR